MGKLSIALLALFGALCLVSTQETTTIGEKASDVNTVPPTRFPQVSTPVPDLVHNASDVVKNSTAEAEKNVQKGSSAVRVVNYGLFFVVLAVCAQF